MTAPIFMVLGGFLMVLEPMFCHTPATPPWGFRRAKVIGLEAGKLMKPTHPNPELEELMAQLHKVK